MYNIASKVCIRINYNVLYRKRVNTHVLDYAYTLTKFLQFNGLNRPKATPVERGQDTPITAPSCASETQ